MTGPSFSFDQRREALAHGTATLHEAAGRIGTLPSMIRGLSPETRLCGPAFTVHSPSYDNLWIHRAVYAASPGDILVVNTGRALEAGYWGEILNEAAMARKLGGLVIEGGVRDSVVLRTQPFPIFCTGLCIQGTRKDFGAKGWLNAPVRIGDVVVQPGDFVCGDADGVVCIPNSRVQSVLEASVARVADEANKIAAIRSGQRTVDLYKLGME